LPYDDASCYATHDIDYADSVISLIAMLPPRRRHFLISLSSFHDALMLDADYAILRRHFRC